MTVDGDALVLYGIADVAVGHVHLGCIIVVIAAIIDV